MSQKEVKSYIEIKKYLDNIKDALEHLNLEKIDKIVKVLHQTYFYDKTIFVFGNGGSSSTSSHFACDLAKGTIVNSWDEQKRLRVICLNDNISLMTAWANDTEYSHIFIEQLKNLVKKDDVVIGISGSGCSCNVIEAIQYAKEMDCTTIGLTGMGGGILAKEADISIVVSSNIIQQVEDVHLILCHLISLLFKELVKNEKVV